MKMKKWMKREWDENKELDKQKWNEMKNKIGKNGIKCKIG